MNKDLRKRLEINAQFYANRVVPDGRSFREELKKEAMDDFKAGAEFGYKEAIEVAKEWLLENTISHYNPDTDARWVDTNECEDSKEFTYRFEADMNKLWEEKK